MFAYKVAPYFILESMMGLRLRKGNLRQVLDFSSLIQGTKRMRLEQSENEPEISLPRPQHHH